jgi:hypothetical protein
MVAQHKHLNLRAIFIDTSAWYAYVNRADLDHSAVSEFLSEFPGSLITSNYIFDELVTLVRMRMGYHKALGVGEVLHNSQIVLLERITHADEEAAWHLFQNRPDKKYSFTDCTSFILMHRLKLFNVLATDEHFRQENFSVFPPA